MRPLPLLLTLIVGQAVHKQPHLFLSTDGDAQRPAKTVSPHLAGDESSTPQEVIGGVGIGDTSEPAKNEVAYAVWHIKADFAQGIGGPPPPSDRVFAHPVDPRLIIQRCQSGQLGGGGDVESPAHPVDGVDDAGRSKAPSQTQPSQRVDLLNGAKHHDIFGFARQL